MYLYLNGRFTWSAGKGKRSDYCKEIGIKDKHYVITNADYRIILSAAVNLVKFKTYNIVFLTQTFPFEPTEKQANEIQKLFLKNLKRYNEKVSNYIWTKERQKNSRIHFHTIIDMSFIPIQDLQADWNNSIKDITGVEYSNRNSVRLPLTNCRVYNSEVLRTVKYIAKYISKERFKPYKQPCYGITKPLYTDIKRKVSDEGKWPIICDENTKLYTSTEANITTFVN